MASFRITLECGDSSCLRTKKTPEGYTHDWEVFVRGVDNAAIHHYIEKVVFNLHETFPKPKRVIKEPPYSLKESGYAGFDIPIHIYLKNKNEPKRFEIMYNLNLETAGPAVNHILHHNEVIHNPSDEFRKKLLKGGATPISSSERAQEKSEVKSVPMVGKPKLSGNDGKKHRLIEPKTSNPFNDLFGPPIKTAKLPVDSKKAEKSASVKTITPEKSEKTDKSAKVKHSPHKDVKKERSSEDRKEKKDRERDSREKEKSKDKAKRSSSPGSIKPNHQGSENKRPPSPTIKKPSTPPPAPKRPSSPSPKQKEKEVKKVESEKEKDKEKLKESLKSTSDESKSDRSEKESKSERKKDKKKHREDRDKEKKDKHKDKEREKSRDKESSTIWEKKVEKPEKIEKEKLLEPKLVKEERKSPKPIKENEKAKEEKVPKSEKLDKTEKSEKHKESKSEKSDKSKHKHKKRDKKDKRDGSKERDRKDKREKSKSVEKHTETSQVPVPALVNSRISDLIDKDSSDSAASGDEEIVSEPRNTKKELPPPPPPPAEVPKSMSPPPPPSNENKKEKNERKRDRSRNAKEEKESKKKRKKAENKEEDGKDEGGSVAPMFMNPETKLTIFDPDQMREKSEIIELRFTSSASSQLITARSSVAGYLASDRIGKKLKNVGDDEVVPKKSKDQNHSSSPLVEPVSSSQSPIATNLDSVHGSKIKHADEPMIDEQVVGDTEQVAPDSTNSTLVDTEEPLVFSEDYVSQLKELQQKIMTLQDNQELQRVVQVIAETGQYEITKKTFDFDLCALDRRTVQRLQQFFAS